MTQHNPQELLPCPFCGNAPSLKDNSTIMCDFGTILELYSIDYPKSVIDKWNHRPNDRREVTEEEIYKIILLSYREIHGKIVDHNVFCRGMAQAIVAHLEKKEGYD